MWQDDTLDSPVLVRAVYFEDEQQEENPVVYFLENDGTIHQKNPETGETIWSFEFDSDMEAEFAISANGNLIIAGDTRYEQCVVATGSIV